MRDVSRKEEVENGNLRVRVFLLCCSRATAA